MTTMNIGEGVLDFTLVQSQTAFDPLGLGSKRVWDWTNFACDKLSTNKHESSFSKKIKKNVWMKQHLLPEADIILIFLAPLYEIFFILT